MKSKLCPAHLNRKQLLAVLLSLALAITCTIGTIVGYTLASASVSLQGASPEAAAFGNGTARAYLEEADGTNPADAPDTLKLILEAVQPANPAAPAACACAEEVLCGGEACEYECDVCEEAVFCGDAACEFECGVCTQAVFCGGGACEFVCDVCQDAVLCGGDVCEFVCDICDGADIFCGDGVCLGCTECEAAVFCGGQACLGCTVCEAAVFCGGQACLGCTVCKPAVFCGGQACLGCAVCKPAVACECDEDCGCGHCDCCESEGEEDPLPLVMNNIVLSAALADHALENFTVKGITITVGEDAYAYPDEPAPGVTVTEDEDGQYEFLLEGPFEAGVHFSAAFALEFNRSDYALQAGPEAPMPLLANAAAAYDCLENDQTERKTQALESPVIIYPIEETAGVLETEFTSVPGPGAVTAGQQITYTIKVSNTGDEALTDIPVSAAVPANTTLLSTPPVSPAPLEAITPATTELEWLIETLEPGEDNALEFTFTVTVQALPAGGTQRSIVATALVNDEEAGTITHTQSAGAALAINKSGETDSGLEEGLVAADDEITYKIEVANRGSEAALDIEITDTLPAGLAYVADSATGYDGTPVDLADCTVTCDAAENGSGFTWTIDALPPGKAAEVSFKAKVTALPANLGGRTFDNTALVNGEETNTVSYRQQGETLDIAKSAVPAGGLVKTDETILYTISAENLSGEPQLDVEMTDALPAGTAFDAAYAPAVKTGSKTLESDEFTFNETNGVVKFVIGSLEADEKAEATFRVKVLAPAAGAQQSTRDIVNVAKVQGKETNQVKHTQPLQALVAVKSAQPASGSTVYARRADGSGTRITYSIEVTNTFDTNATDVKIKDTLPEGLTYVPGSMTAENTKQTLNGTAIEGKIDSTGKQFNWQAESIAPGKSVTVQFQADVSSLPADKTTREFVNSALVNDTATNAVKHYQFISDLKAVKSADHTSGKVKAGDIITYIIEVENKGSGTETGLKVFDAIPKGTEYVKDSALLTMDGKEAKQENYDSKDGGSLNWAIGDLNPGEKAAVAFKAKVLALPKDTESLSIRNKASVGEGSTALATNEVVHTLKAEGGKLNFPGLPDIDIDGNIIGNGSNNNVNSNNNNAAGNNAAGSIGGKDIPKTSEASAVWAILLVLGSGAAIAAVTVVLVLRKKKSLQAD